MVAFFPLINDKCYKYVLWIIYSIILYEIKSNKCERSHFVAAMKNLQLSFTVLKLVQQFYFEFNFLLAPR